MIRFLSSHVDILIVFRSVNEAAFLAQRQRHYIEQNVLKVFIIANPITAVRNFTRQTVQSSLLSTADTQTAVHLISRISDIVKPGGLSSPFTTFN